MVSMTSPRTLRALPMTGVISALPVNHRVGGSLENLINWKISSRVNDRHCLWGKLLSSMIRYRLNVPYVDESLISSLKLGIEDLNLFHIKPKECNERSLGIMRLDVNAPNSHYLIDSRVRKATFSAWGLPLPRDRFRKRIIRQAPHFRWCALPCEKAQRIMHRERLYHASHLAPLFALQASKCRDSKLSMNGNQSVPKHIDCDFHNMKGKLYSRL